MEYRKTLKRVLTEQLGGIDDYPDAELDRSALRSSMDPSGSDDQYDIEGLQHDENANLQQMREQVVKWSKKIISISNELNGTEAESLQNKMLKVGKHPAFGDIIKIAQDFGKASALLASIGPKLAQVANYAETRADELKAKNESVWRKTLANVLVEG